MSLFRPLDDDIDVRLTSSELELLVSALRQGDMMLRVLGDSQDFVPELSAMHRNLAMRLEAMISGNSESQALH